MLVSIHSQTWSSLVAGDDGSHLINRKTNIEIVHHELSLSQPLITWADTSLHLLF